MEDAIAKSSTDANVQAFVRDVVIGMADGLTVPFALAAGLAGALPTTWLVVIAGLAEIAAGCIAMGLGAYMAVMSDHDYFHTQLTRHARRIAENPHEERVALASLLVEVGVPPSLIDSVVNGISEHPDKWLAFVLKYDLGVEHPSPGRARNSSVTIGLSYVVGGIIPLFPYMVIKNDHAALVGSVVITLVALFAFGLAKAKVLGTTMWKSGLQTMLVGGLAALVAYVAARWIA